MPAAGFANFPQVAKYPPGAIDPTADCIRIADETEQTLVVYRPG